MCSRGDLESFMLLTVGLYVGSEIGTICSLPGFGLGAYFIITRNRKIGEVETQSSNE